MTDELVSEPSVVGMVERVARELALKGLERSAARHEGEGQSKWTLDNPAERARHIDYMWKSYVADARAAIAAMREPTEGMVASFPVPDPAGPLLGKIDMYRAMIDSALAEDTA